VLLSRWTSRRGGLGKRLHGRGDISVSGCPALFHHPFGKFHHDGLGSHGELGTGHLAEWLSMPARPAKDRAPFTEKRREINIPTVNVSGGEPWSQGQAKTKRRSKCRVVLLLAGTGGSAAAALGGFKLLAKLL
jgi:hypothetical protein